MTKFKTLILLTFIAIFCGHIVLVNAQDKNENKPSSQKPSQEKSLGLTTEFVSEGQDLTPNFVGHNFVDMFEVLAKRKTSLVKSEFETKKDFEERVSKQVETPLFGTIKLTSLLAFVFKKSVTNKFGDNPFALRYNNGLSSSYDAERKVMTFKLETLSSGSWRELELPVISAEESTYNGTNVYGASVEIKKTESYGAKLLIKNWKVERKIEIPMSTAEAVSAKENAAVLIVGRLAEPYIHSSEDERKPTFKDPNHTITHFAQILLSLEEIWLYDSTTGKVFLRQKVRLTR